MPTPLSRFAPSTTGPAHPGTLLAALLAWLDARSSGGQVLLRLEDLDPDRCRPQWSDEMDAALAWLGLDWDARRVQSDARADHEAALDVLAATGRLYPCRCSRSDLAAVARRSPAGGFAYPGTCRERALPRDGWRGLNEALRLRLDPGTIALRDESGRDLSADPPKDYGDPVVRRRDGAVAYHLAGVVDDAREGVTRVVRGHDLAATTATQVALQRCLGAATPAYRHHLLLLEERGEKLAKLHHAVGYRALREHHSAAELCGILAAAAGLRDAPEPLTPDALLSDFSWSRVGVRDRTLRWTGSALLLLPPADADPASHDSQDSRYSK